MFRLSVQKYHILIATYDLEVQQRKKSTKNIMCAAWHFRPRL